MSWSTSFYLTPKKLSGDYIIKSKGISTRSGEDSRIQGVPKYVLGFRLGLLETEAAAVFLPLATLLKQIDTLETLQNVALRRDLAGTSKTAMLTHDFFLLLKKMFAYCTKYRPPTQAPIFEDGCAWQKEEQRPRKSPQSRREASRPKPTRHNPETPT